MESSVFEFCSIDLLKINFIFILQVNHLLKETNQENIYIFVSKKIDIYPHIFSGVSV